MSRILVVAGTDSSGGAGMSRDIAMAESLNCSVAPVVTAVTVQTNRALIDIQPISPELIAAQVKAAFDPGGQPPKAIKIGMIGTPEAAVSLAQSLPGGLPIVLDPVLKSSSGGRLMSLQSLAPLLPKVTLLTPNLEESARLSGCVFYPEEPPDLPQIKSQAQKILARGVAAVLIKGGHGHGASSVDHLFTTTSHQAFSAPRLAGSKRGTGCSLATALTCALAQGRSVEEACAQAKTQIGLWLSQTNSDGSPSP